MINTSKIVAGWALGGLVIGLIFALLAAGPGGAGAFLIPLGLVLGFCFSVLHCLVLFFFEKFTDFKRLVPLAGLTILVSLNYLDLMYNDYTCEISETDSLVKAVNYTKKIGYKEEFLGKTGYKLESTCEYGFEYESKEHFNLVIVDANGHARLND
jgi:hypothetical protein